MMRGNALRPGGGGNSLAPGNIDKVLFAGKSAKTADKAALAEAEGLESVGASPDFIWRSTGWGRSADGQWRFEIDDSLADMAGGAPPASRAPWPLDKVYSHPEFEAAYPGMMRNTLKYQTSDASPQGNAMYDARNKVITVGSGALDPDTQTELAKLGGMYDRRAVTLHEMQHGIQDREGFAFGMIPSQVPAHELADEMARLSPRESRALNAERIARQNAYARSRGEVEARNVQIRRNLTGEQRRDVPPWLTEDTPRNRQY